VKTESVIACTYAYISAVTTACDVVSVSGVHRFTFHDGVMLYGDCVCVSIGSMVDPFSDFFQVASETANVFGKSAAAELAEVLRTILTSCVWN